MKILAIEASGPVAGCALYEDGTLIAEYSAQYKKKHSQSLVPMLQEMKNMVSELLRQRDSDSRWKSRSFRFPLWTPWPAIFSARTG